MAVDYLSAMNVGSGLNVTQIVDALVDAEKAPREAQINAKIEEKTVSISALAEVKQEFSALSTNLTALSQVSAIKLQTTGPAGASTAITATVNNTALLTTFDHNIDVNTLAQPQTISFSGYSTETAALDASALTINLGTWSVDGGGNYSFANNSAVGTQSISLNNTDTIATVRDKINNLGVGISASIVKISNTDYGLTLISKLGTENQIRVQATSTSASISNLSFDPATNGSGAANGGDAQKQVASATNASIDFNGVTVTRSSNQLTDLIPGVTIDLNAVSSSKERIQATYDEEISLAAMKIFVSELNTITNNLIEKTKISATEDSGPLVGDTLMRAYKSSLRKITTTPISGYGTDDIYLSNFGVMTNQDGTITLDETKFKSYFAAKPEQFAALTTNNVTTSNLSVTGQMTGSLWKPGTYEFLSLIQSASSVISANESKSQTFKSIDSSFGASDGELSDNLQAYVADYPGGSWSITGTDRSHLTINSDGVVTITGGTDREVKPTYSFNIVYTVTDTNLPSSFRTFTEAVTFNVNDLDERTYTLATPSVPAVVYAGDTFSIAVDGQTVTTAAIASDGDSSYTVAKLVAALNSANAALSTSADGVFSESGSNIIFKYNDSATAQTSTMSVGLTYSPGTPLGTPGVSRQGAVTSRTVTFDENSSDINNAIRLANENDIFKVDIQTGGSTTPVAYTITSSDVTAIGNFTTATQRINYLAGKLDTAANTAASGSDVGYAFSNTAGTRQIERITAPTVPTIASGDKFKVTINGTEIETATATSQSSLSDIVNMLNTANAAPIVPGTFSVSNTNDIIFTYTNSEPVSGTISKLFFLDSSSGSSYDSGTGSGAQSTAGLDGKLTVICNTSGTAKNSDTIENLKKSTNGGGAYSTLGSGLQNAAGTSTTEITVVSSPVLPTVKAGDKFSLRLDNNGSPFTVTTAALNNNDNLTAISNALNTAHGGTNGTFSVSGSNLNFTYNDTNAGNIGNSQDAGLTYIPNPGSISLTATAANHVHLTTVTEDSHTAGDTVAVLGDILMSLESGVFKITSGDAIGVQISASGNQSASIYVGKSLSESVTDFADGVLGTNGDIDEKVNRYNLDIDKFNEQLSTLETRMKNERQRYVEQFTAMETAVASFKETSSILDNLMESWKASFS